MIFFYGDASIEVEKLSYSVAEKFEVVGNKLELFEIITNSNFESIIVIGSKIGLSEAFSISEECRAKYGGVRVILMRTRIDVDILARAMRSGVMEVVSVDDTMAFAKSIQHARELMKEFTAANLGRFNDQKKRARVVVVFSAKGGCGKTTISVNLANALGAANEKRVCLVDLDLQFGDIAVALQQNPEKTISSAIAMGNEIDSFGARSMITSYSGNLDLLLAPTNPTDVEYISGDLVSKLIRVLSTDYDYIVIDTPPAFTDFVLSSMEIMDTCYLITTLDMPAIKNLKIVLETMEALKIDNKKLRFIVNKSDAKTGMSVAEVEQLLNHEIDYKIPNDICVSQATNVGEPVSKFAPKSSVSKEIEKLARDLINEDQNGEITIGKKRRFSPIPYRRRT